MSGAAMWRLFAGWMPSRSVLAVVGIAFGLGTILIHIRRGVAPPEGPHGLSILVLGAVSFLGSGAVSALIASQWAAVRACPFAWNTPAVMRRFSLALRRGALITVPAMAVLGALLHGSLGWAIGFLPLMSAAGYAVGVVNTAESHWALRMGGLMALALASAPVLLGPEIDGAIRGWSMAWAAGACAALAVVIRQSSVMQSLQRDRLDPGWGGSWAEFCMRQWKAPRGGAAPGGHTRRSTWDWVQAVLHAAHGQQGGVVRAGIRIAIMVVLALVWVRLVILPWASWVPTASASDPAAVVSAPSSGADPSRWMARFATTDTGGSGLITIFLCGLGLTVMSCMVPSVPVLGVRVPLSRLRWARVLWWRTQVEECTYLLFAVATLVTLGLVLANQTGAGAWTNVGSWIEGLVAMFALVPLARVMRLHVIRSPDPFSDMSVLRGTVAWTSWAGVMICMAALLLGTHLVMVGWDETMLHLRAELPPDLRPWTVLLAIPPIVLLRWLWLRILVRHLRTCDLNVE
jgi:hypothetical protein